MVQIHGSGVVLLHITPAAVFVVSGSAPGLAAAAAADAAAVWPSVAAVQV